jgi:hypothetical protein
MLVKPQKTRGTRVHLLTENAITPVISKRDGCGVGAVTPFWLAPALAVLSAGAAAAQDQSFELFCIPGNGGGIGVDNDAQSLKVRFANGPRVQVLGVRRADDLIAKHTLIVIDLLHSSAASHKAMLEETFNVTRYDPPTDLTIIAVGDSPANFARMPLSNGSVASVLTWDLAEVEELVRGRVGQRRKWELYWVPVPGERTGNVIDALTRWFTLKSGPIRVIWIADDFRWFGTEPTCDPAAGSWCTVDLDKVGPAWYHLTWLIAMGVSVFPMLAGDRAESDGARKYSLASRDYLAYFLGGFPLEGPITGDGRALALGLRNTSTGLLLELAAGQTSSCEFRKCELIVESIRTKKQKYSRPVELPKEKLRQPGPGGATPITVTLPRFDLGTRLEWDGTGSKSMSLVLTLPTKPDPKKTGNLQVLVDRVAVAPPERPLLIRRQIPWSDVRETAEGGSISIALPDGVLSVSRVIVFDEATGWAGVRTVNLTAPTRER